MSGSFQHHIPQMLQRGFRVPGGSRKSSKVWVYERGREARIERVKDVGGEDHFYSELPKDGLKTLDDRLTEYETSLDGILQGLKKTDAGGTVDPKHAGEVIAHLTIRNAYLRRTVTLGTEKVYADAAILFGDEANLRPILGVDDTAPSTRFKEAIDDLIDNSPELLQLGLPKRALYHLGQMILKEQFGRFFNEQVPQLVSVIAGASAIAPQTARDSHNKALGEGFVPSARVQELESLQWSVHSPSQASYVLPDCVALGLDDEPGFKPFLLCNSSKIKVVLFPLSSAKMLVGLRSGQQVPDLAVFNEAASACSQEFFIANHESDDLKRFQNLIGTTTSAFVAAAVGSAVQEFKKGDMPALEQPADQASKTAAGTPVQEQEALIPPGYRVEFQACADEPTAKQIAAVLNAITNELGKIIPLGRLDGFTFANDYEAALRNLPRGFETQGPLVPTAFEYGTSVSMTPTVFRDGVAKTHIVLRGDIGHCLLSGDESQWRLAFHVVIGQLAGVANLEMFERALPGISGKKIENRYAAFLYQYVAPAWDAYYSARTSATFNPQAGDGYCELLLAALKAAQQDIPAARYDYRFHGDLNRFLDVALPRIRNILWFSGKLLGHCDSLATPLLINDELKGALEAAQLTNWFVLFDTELSEHWSRQGRWATFEEFLHLNRHVERLLWAFAIFPWQNDDGEIRIEIPVQSDAYRLNTMRALFGGILTSVVQLARRLLSRLKLA